MSMSLSVSLVVYNHFGEGTTTLPREIVARKKKTSQKKILLKSVIEYGRFDFLLAASGGFTASIIQ